jgi:hypothetical protein
LQKKSHAKLLFFSVKVIRDTRRHIVIEIKAKKQKTMHAFDLLRKDTRVDVLTTELANNCLRTTAWSVAA